MIITGKFYQTTATPQSDTAQAKAAAQTDSLTALKSFFNEDTSSKGFADTVQISQKALSILQDYAAGNTDASSSASDTTTEASILDYFKQKAQTQYGSNASSLFTSNDSDASSVLDEMTQYMSGYSNRQISDVFQKVKDANQQMSDEFIINASRYGVQNLL